MAARKKGPVGIGSLFIASPPPAPAPPPKAPGTPIVAERAFRVVPTEPEEDVTIEPEDDGRFWITFVRHNGTTRSAFLVTRAQLEKLVRRAPAALEVG
jgi:hypothetical protein